MANDNILKLDKKMLSQLDLGGVLKSAHDDRAQALRVINGVSEVPSSYSRVVLTYNISGSVTQALFYEGTQANKTEVAMVADVAGSLNNQYFQIFTENNETKYHVWYNVSGGGTDPAPASSIGIEIPIQTGDAAEIVALATDLYLKNIPDFTVTRYAQKLCIENARKGTSSSALDFGTGFTLTTIVSGAERLLKAIDIPYDGYTKYIYNTQERVFEVVSTSNIIVDISAAEGDTIAISSHENPRNLTATNTLLAAGLSTSAYTSVLSYTVAEDLNIRTVKVKADTFGTFRLKINGVLKDYFSTSPLERNCKFDFLEEELISNGQQIVIEFLPDRLYIASYDFFLRIEAYAL